MTARQLWTTGMVRADDLDEDDIALLPPYAPFDKVTPWPDAHGNRWFPLLAVFRGGGTPGPGYGKETMELVEGTDESMMVIQYGQVEGPNGARTGHVELRISTIIIHGHDLVTVQVHA